MYRFENEFLKCLTHLSSVYQFVQLVNYCGWQYYFIWVGIIDITCTPGVFYQMED